LDGIGNKLIVNANCGYSCKAGDYEQLSNNILKMYYEKESKMNQFGLNAKKFYDDNFAKEVTLNKLENLF
jgi:hypothetical protein